ncbi:hypothetical protein [Streptosporangium sp. NPDC002721]|uniref:hypothetical protein n=1 Tax=Streptosporangium sp. NPDC002721 TaxID=3366188 RepID=UPI0036BBB482
MTAPQELAILLRRLEGGNVLHPDGEYFGTTRRILDDEAVRFMGNFWDYSHAFCITTSDPKLIARLDDAIAKQRASEAYIAAREENRVFHASWPPCGALGEQAQGCAS